MEKIPLIDLQAQYQSIKTEIDDAISECLNKSQYIGGTAVSDFENEFAEFCGTSYCASCANGTDAIEIALNVLKIGKGDEVIVPAMTFIASAEAVINVGAKVNFCDIEQNTGLIDYRKIESVITKETKAIIVVHLFGQMAEMCEIIKIAKKHNLFIIEDAAQAHGALYDGKGPGNWGDIAAFSFYPGKNLGAYGDGGAIVTNSEQWYLQFKRISNHGRLKKFDHNIIGRNSRLDSIQAKVLSVKLKNLKIWNDLRQEKAKLYYERLKENPHIAMQNCNPLAKHVYHVFYIRVEQQFRDKLLHYLEENGISAGIHYPVAPFETPALMNMKYSQKYFPEAHNLSKECISLPIYPEITSLQQEYVCDIILEFFQNTK